MTYTLRPYQQRVIDDLYAYWMTHVDTSIVPILELPTGAGKSLVIAELVRLLFDTWPEDHPRTVVLVPSRELAEQNAEKLRAILPARISVGYYSASLGRKDEWADVIVATIGSIYKHAHKLGNIRCVLIDECHMVNPDGSEAGRYRKFLTDLAKLCVFRTAGMTATSFRGNGVWLTEGKDPLFSGIASKVTVQELLNNDPPYLSALVRPMDVIKTRIDTDGVKVASTGDYSLDELDARVSEYLPAVVAETLTLAAERKKWIAFTPTVKTAEQLVDMLRDESLTAELVCGETPKTERQAIIERYKRGEIRCLVTVMALATGFDVPDVDCLIWCRPTKSPVLYVQGFGRGMRVAPGKADCLVLDFSDTVERLGPVDAIRGRSKRETSQTEAPSKTCPECAHAVRPASAPVCPECGYEFPPPPEQEARKASNAAVMSHQVKPKIHVYDVTRVSYAIHKKEGKPDSLKVSYYSGMRVVAQEWVCFGHQGFARAKAEQWWDMRIIGGKHWGCPATSQEALSTILTEISAALQARDTSYLKEPTHIKVDETTKYPEVIGYKFEQQEQAA